jgi:hypothetical protein
MVALFGSNILIGHTSARVDNGNQVNENYMFVVGFAKLSVIRLEGEDDYGALSMALGQPRTQTPQSLRKLAASRPSR